jgi:hypothetical protein
MAGRMLRQVRRRLSLALEELGGVDAASPYLLQRARERSDALWRVSGEPKGRRLLPLSLITLHLHDDVVAFCRGEAPPDQRPRVYRVLMRQINRLRRMVMEDEAIAVRGFWSEPFPALRSLREVLMDLSWAMVSHGPVAAGDGRNWDDELRSGRERIEALMPEGAHLNGALAAVLADR